MVEWFVFVLVHRDRYSMDSTAKSDTYERFTYTNSARIGDCVCAKVNRCQFCVYVCKHSLYTVFVGLCCVWATGAKQSVRFSVCTACVRLYTFVYFVVNHEMIRDFAK